MLFFSAQSNALTATVARTPQSRQSTRSQSSAGPFPAEPRRRRVSGLRATRHAAPPGVDREPEPGDNGSPRKE
jgi:hypothetical protein